MIPVGLKAGSMGLKILRQLYGAKAKVWKATKKVAEAVGKKVTSGSRQAGKTIKKYPKTASAVGGAIAFDIFDDA